MQNTRSIYILLTRTNSIVSRAIGSMTHAEYTHVAVSMDFGFGEVYSFSRRYKRLPLPGALVHENLSAGIYQAKKDPPCRVYRVTMSEENFNRIDARIRAMFAQRKRYHYNYLGVVANYFGRRYVREDRFFCSEFVASLLKTGNCAPGVDPHSMRPVDFMTLPQLECVYTGSVRELLAYSLNLAKQEGTAMTSRPLCAD